MGDITAAGCDVFIQGLQPAKGAEGFGRSGNNWTVFAYDNVLNSNEDIKAGEEQLRNAPEGLVSQQGFQPAQARFYAACFGD